MLKLKAWCSGKRKIQRFGPFSACRFVIKMIITRNTQHNIRCAFKEKKNQDKTPMQNIHGCIIKNIATRGIIIIPNFRQFSCTSTKNRRFEFWKQQIFVTAFLFAFGNYAIQTSNFLVHKLTRTQFTIKTSAKWNIKTLSSVLTAPHTTSTNYNFSRHFSTLFNSNFHTFITFSIKRTWLMECIERSDSYWYRLPYTKIYKKKKKNHHAATHSSDDHNNLSITRT